MAVSDILWTERYRPRTLDDLALPERVMQRLRGAELNLLLYGGAGLGKTSAAKVLAAGRPTKFINCSLHTGVDEVRNSITDFCSNASVLDDEGTHKVVVLDEVDGVSDQYFKALRGVMEQFHVNARFIATTNHFTKIPDAIQSRFDCVSFDLLPEEEQQVKAQYMRRAYHVLRAEGMSIEKDALVALVNRSFPDLRRVVSALQGMHGKGVRNVTAIDVSSYRGENSELFAIVCSPQDPVANYKQLHAYSNRVEDAIRALGREFVEHIIDEHPRLSQRIGSVLYEVNRHSYESRFAIDPFVTLLSLVYKLQSLLV